MQDSFVLKDGTVIPRRKRGFGWQGFIFCIIPFISFFAFSLFPIGYSLVVSFTDMGLYNSIEPWNFMGLRNYAEVFRDMFFWHTIGLGFYCTLGQFLSLSVALAMSTLLSTKVKGWNLFSALYFIPYICSSVAVSMIWKRMFDTDYGIINEMISLFGYTGSPIAWSGQKSTYMLIFIIIQAWSTPGYGIIMYNAAYTSIDGTLYEAAKIDGASRGRQFLSITLPQLSPTTYFLLMLGIISGLQQFEMFSIFTGEEGGWTGITTDGPESMGFVPLIYINITVKGGNTVGGMGYAAAMSWFLFFIVFGVARLNEKFSKVWVANENE